MIALFLERLALLSSLSAIVLAVLWPHIRPKIFPLLEKFVQATLSVFFSLPNDNNEQQQRVSLSNEQAFEHPKFSGHRLKRVTNEKQSYRSTFGSLGGFSQSRLDGQPSFAHGSAQPHGGSPFGRGHQMVPGQGGQRNQFQSSMSLTIFTACVMALIVYTLMKMLTVKLGRVSSSTSSSSTNGRWPSGAQSYSQRLHRASMETRDLRRDKRRLLKLSREERTRELILHHGGKNVSRAVRFLADELAKQKRLLVESLSANLPCDCCCHSTADFDQGVPMTEEAANARTTSALKPEPTTSTSSFTAKAAAEIEDEITEKVGEQASRTARVGELPS